MPKRGPSPDSVPERFVRLLVEYGGLPLTADDVAEELGAKRSTIQTVATSLVREGRVRREHLGRTALYRAGEGVRA